MEIGLGQTRLVSNRGRNFEGAMHILMARMCPRSITIVRYGILYMCDVGDLRKRFAIRKTMQFCAFVNTFTFVLL